MPEIKHDLRRSRRVASSLLPMLYSVDLRTKLLTARLAGWQLLYGVSIAARPSVIPDLAPSECVTASFQGFQNVSRLLMLSEIHPFFVPSGDHVVSAWRRFHLPTRWPTCRACFQTSCDGDEMLYHF